MRLKARWLLSDGLPILLGFAMFLAANYVAIFVFRGPQRVAAALTPQRIVHWWSCNNGAPGTPTWSPNGQEIAFAAKGRCDVEIVVVHRDGSGRRVLTHSFAFWPAWSPDGRSILVASHGGVAAVPASGGKPVVVGGGESDVGAAWSTDGARIAFTHGYLPSVGGDYESTLYVMSRDGGDVRRLIGHSCDPGTPAWSPRANVVAVGCHDGIYLLDVGTGARRRVVKESFGFDPPTPSWSPDGKRLAYVEDGRGINVVPADGSAAPSRLIASHSQPWADTAAWSADGRWIAFSVWAGKPTDGIYVARSNGRDVHRIARL